VRHTLREFASIKKERFNVLKKEHALRESTSIKGQWQANAQCYNNIKREQEAQSSFFLF